MTHTAKHMLELNKCDLHILRVNSKNLMHMSGALPEIHFTDLHRNMIIALWTITCDTNNESETNIVIRINACKKFLLALVLVHSTIVVSIIFGVSLTILVMAPAEVVLSGVLEPITLFRLTLALIITLGSNCWRKYILKLLA